MIANLEKNIARARVKFVLGLGVLISLIYYSVLRQQQIEDYEYTLLWSFTLTALIIDYLKLGQFLNVFKEQKENNCSRDSAIRAALKATLKSPYLFRLAGTELLTLYYAFFAKYERHDIVSDNRLFSYAKSSNAYDVFLFVALSQLPFLPFIHILLEHQKGPAPAWAITLLTLWSVIWYLAQVEAVRFRPVELSNEHLRYRFGLLWWADIPLGNIRMARNIDAIEKLDGKDTFLSPLGSKRNVMLEFETPIQFTGPYFLKKRKRRAAISLDDPSHFLSRLALRGVVTG